MLTREGAERLYDAVIGTDKMLLTALQECHKIADGWCCDDDSGPPSERFKWIADIAQAAIEREKNLLEISHGV